MGEAQTAGLKKNRNILQTSNERLSLAYSVVATILRHCKLPRACIAPALGRMWLFYRTSQASDNPWDACLQRSILYTTGLKRICSCLWHLVYYDTRFLDVTTWRARPFTTRVLRRWGGYRMLFAVSSIDRLGCAPRLHCSSFCYLGLWSFPTSSAAKRTDISECFHGRPDGRDSGRKYNIVNKLQARPQLNIQYDKKITY